MLRTARKYALQAMTAAGAVAVLASCGPKEAPRPAPPPPPQAVVIPPRPIPPNGASPMLVVPALRADGLFESVNRSITPAQTAWNLRSAYNVGALNCAEPQRTEITNGYRAFLKAHARTLTRINSRVDSEFRSQHGSRYIPVRETYMTNVYNHFALPPTLPAFCNAVAAMARDAQLIKSTELEAFAARSLPSIEIVYDDFYHRYSAYRAELAAWEARYGALASAQTVTAISQPLAQ